jgi:hypothetical protein
LLTFSGIEDPSRWVHPLNFVALVVVLDLTVERDHRANYCHLPPPVPAELDGKLMANDQGPASLEREPGL